MKNLDKGAIARLIVLVVTLVNVVLSYLGTYQIPAMDESTQMALALLISTVAQAVSYWKNNSWTEGASIGDKIKDLFDNSDVTGEQIVDAIEELIDRSDAKKE
jgi:SPP1 family holin